MIRGEEGRGAMRSQKNTEKKTHPNAKNSEREGKQRKDIETIVSHAFNSVIDL